MEIILGILAGVIVVAIVGLLFIKKKQQQALNAPPLTPPSSGVEVTSAAGVAATTADAASSVLDDINVLIQGRHYDEAEVTLKKFLLTNPNDSTAVLKLLQIYGITNNFSAFEKLHQKIHQAGDADTIEQADYYRSLIDLPSAVGQQTPTATINNDIAPDVLIFDLGDSTPDADTSASKLESDRIFSSQDNAALADDALSDDLISADLSLEDAFSESDVSAVSTTNDNVFDFSLDSALEVHTPEEMPLFTDFGMEDVLAAQSSDMQVNATDEISIAPDASIENTLIDLDLSIDDAVATATDSSASTPSFSTTNDFIDLSLYDTPFSSEADGELSTTDELDASLLVNFDDTPDLTHSTPTQALTTDHQSFDTPELIQADFGYDYGAITHNDNVADALIDLDAVDSIDDVNPPSAITDSPAADDIEIIVPQQSLALEPKEDVLLDNAVDGKMDAAALTTTDFGTPVTDVPEQQSSLFADDNTLDLDAIDFTALDDIVDNHETMSVLTEVGDTYTDLNIGDFVTEPVAPPPSDFASNGTPAQVDVSLTDNLLDSISVTQAPRLDEVLIAGDTLAHHDIFVADTAMTVSTDDISTTKLDVDVSAAQTMRDADTHDIKIANDYTATPQSNHASYTTSVHTKQVSAATDFNIVDQLDNTQITLNLANQYLDLGEHDSAKRLLVEVVRYGNHQQQTTAQTLLERLS